MTASWWHSYGAISPSGVTQGAWVQMILGPSEMTPEQAAGKTYTPPATDLFLSHLASWDHKPSDDELAEHWMPEHGLWSALFSGDPPTDRDFIDNAAAQPRRMDPNWELNLP